jgi:hypothetical protein
MRPQPLHCQITLQKILMSKSKTATNQNKSTGKKVKKSQAQKTARQPKKGVNSRKRRASNGSNSDSTEVGEILAPRRKKVKHVDVDNVDNVDEDEDDVEDEESEGEIEVVVDGEDDDTEAEDVEQVSDKLIIVRDDTYQQYTCRTVTLRTGTAAISQPRWP